jgi:hypothetical protein
MTYTTLHTVSTHTGHLRFGLYPLHFTLLPDT